MQLGSGSNRCFAALHAQLVLQVNSSTRPAKQARLFVCEQTGALEREARSAKLVVGSDCLDAIGAMPLIVVAGLPSSGKSSVAAALAEACRALGQDVQVVDEDSLHLKRNESYKGALLPPLAPPPPLLPPAACSLPAALLTTFHLALVNHT